MKKLTDDFTGQRFTRLLVLGKTIKRNRTAYQCRCDCGKETIVRPYELRNSEIKSCGCLSAENAGTRLKTAATHGHARVGSKTKTYNIWVAMRKRCQNPNDAGYHRYGGRGITVCERWESFENFLEDMGDQPPGLQLDREKNWLGYSPENCRWVAKEINVNNTRANHVITHDGKTQNLGQWAAEQGIGEATIRYRLKAGWSIAKALTVLP